MNATYERRNAHFYLQVLPEDAARGDQLREQISDCFGTASETVFNGQPLVIEWHPSDLAIDGAFVADLSYGETWVPLYQTTFVLASVNESAVWLMFPRERDGALDEEIVAISMAAIDKVAAADA